MHQLPNRQSQRLKGYDYSRNGFYFITIICQDRVERFGEIIDGEMALNDAGRMVESVWNDMPKYYGIENDVYVIMPNHFHGIIVIDDGNTCQMNRATTGGSPLQSPSSCRGSAPVPARDNISGNLSLSDIIHRFKSLTTNRYSNGVTLGLVKPFNKRLYHGHYRDNEIKDFCL